MNKNITPVGHWMARIADVPDGSRHDRPRNDGAEQIEIEAGSREMAYNIAVVRAGRGRVVLSLTPLAIIISVYDCGQAYGGHEEGGWWFDYGIPSSSHLHLMRVFSNSEEAREYISELSAECERMNAADHRQRHTSADTGWYAAIWHQNAMPAPFPATTPHYE